MDYTPKKDYNDKFKKGICYIKEYLKNSSLSFCINAVYIFGSTVKGTNRFDSDIDILICFSDDIQKITDYKKQMRMIKSDLSFINNEYPEVDTKIFIGNSWLSDTSHFCNEIRKDGINIWH